MTDEDIDSDVAEELEFDNSENERPETSLDEYEQALEANHDNLDSIKEGGRMLGQELENLMETLDDDAEKMRCQKLIHSSVLLFERVDRGDHQIVRGL